MSGMRFIVDALPPLAGRKATVLLTLDEMGGATWTVGDAETHEKLAAGANLRAVLRRALTSPKTEPTQQQEALIGELVAGIVEGFGAICQRAQGGD